MRRVILAGAVCGLSFAPHGVHAQDSAVIDVTATIVAATAPLSVSGVQNLDFGTVSLPSGDSGGCGYQLGPDGSTFVRGLDGPRENCSFIDTNQQAGIFSVTCDPNADLTLGVSFQSTITDIDPEVAFSTTSFDTLLDGSAPYDGPAVCAANGNSAVTVGGDLTVGQNASALTASTSIGTITLEVSY